MAVLNFDTRTRNTEALSRNRKTLALWKVEKSKMKRTDTKKLGTKLEADVYTDRGGRSYYFDGRNIRRV